MFQTASTVIKSTLPIRIQKATIKIINHESEREKEGACGIRKNKGMGEIMQLYANFKNLKVIKQK